MTSRKLRDPQGWNAGLFRALTLSDGAFKLYVWLRLNSRLDTGTLEISQMDLAKALKKSRGTIRTNLTHLEHAGVCQTRFPRHSRARGWIRIADDYWPYERSESESDSPELRAYLESVRAMLAERACVRQAFSTADELLAREWHARGVRLEQIGQAILLGCARKYVSWRNGAARIAIGSLKYFEPILTELEAQNIPVEYWDYTRHRIQRMEKLWFIGKECEDRPDLEPTMSTQNGGISRPGSDLDR